MWMCFKYALLVIVLMCGFDTIKCASLDGGSRNIRAAGGGPVASPLDCGAAQWRCKNGDCVDIQQRCDNFPDCLDSSDEASCHKKLTCVEGQLTCQSGDCIDAAMFCDGVEDCPDGSDERFGCGNGSTDDTTTVSFTSTTLVETSTTDVTEATTLNTTEDFNSTLESSTQTISFETPTSTFETATETTTFDMGSTETTTTFESATTQTLPVSSSTDVTAQQSTDQWATTATVTSSDTTLSADQNATTVFESTTAGNETVPPATSDTTNATVSTISLETTTPKTIKTTSRPATRRTTTEKREGNYCMQMEDYGNFCKRRYRGYYRHPSKCSNFIMCEWGLLYLCGCPPRTVWDVRIESCVWDFLVAC